MSRDASNPVDVDLYPVKVDRPAPAVLVLPGGGFREHTAHDGEGYAAWLNTLGVAAAVVRYKLVPDLPLALQQARSALGGLQSGALLPNVDPEKTGVIGSSAGGLLAGLLATGTVLSIESRTHAAPRPAFHIQSYGLADLALLPAAAVGALLGDNVKLAAELSPARHVDGKTPPSFIWATAQDGPGLPNALEWARALADHEIPIELHVYPDGGHGIGLADGVPTGDTDTKRFPTRPIGQRLASIGYATSGSSSKPHPPDSPIGGEATFTPYGPVPTTAQERLGGR